MQNRKLVIGYIGNGKSTNRYHLPFVLNRPDKIRVKMIYQRNLAKQDWARIVGVEYTDDLEKILHDPEIDVLVSSFWLTDAGITKMRLSFDQMISGMKNVLRCDPSGDGEAEKITWEKFLRHPKYPGMTAAVRRELWKKAAALSWPETAAHDWMINELAAERGGFYRIPDRLVFYRQHGGNTTGTAADRAGDEAVKSRVKLLRMMADAAEMLCGRDSLVGSTAGSQNNQEKITARRKHIAVCTASMLRRRADLLERPFSFETVKKLLFYNLRNLRYMSIQSLCGDLFCFIRKQRQFLN